MSDTIGRVGAVYVLIAIETHYHIACLSIRPTEVASVSICCRLVFHAKVVDVVGTEGKGIVAVTIADDITTIMNILIVIDTVITFIITIIMFET